MRKHWQIWIDVGGTFTDCLALSPDDELTAHKLLSTGVYKLEVAAGSSASVVKLAPGIAYPAHFFDGFVCQGRSVKTFDHKARTLAFEPPLAKVPEARSLLELASGEPAPVSGIRYLLGKSLADPIGAVEVRLGTTRGTNALLERQGARTAFVTTEGFGDVLAIGYQNRPELFALNIRKATPLYEEVIEVSARHAADGSVLRPLDREAARAAFEGLKKRGIEALAICLLHAHVNPEHEQELAALAAPLGFRRVSLSSEVAGLQRIVPRGETTVVDAYLTPVIADYVESVRRALPEASLRLMTSAGGLVEARRFVGKDSILSGPAGGAQGVAEVAREAGLTQAIGFDMGGTSTDVCRFDGRIERRYEMELKQPGGGGVRIVAPMLAIETVAAGGGSICGFDGERLTVGPESAGAEPGPACYGRGGPLTITDLNLLLGRLVPAHFAFPLNVPAAKAKLEALRQLVNQIPGKRYDLEELALGLLQVASSNMAQPIKRISLARGYDVRDYVLVSFGGAAAQQACQVAAELGMTKILQHPHASLLSAFGMGAAEIQRFGAVDVGLPLGAEALARAQEKLDGVRVQLAAELEGDAGAGARVVETRSLDLRYKGQDSVINIEAPADGDYARSFTAAHRRLYGFDFPGRAIEVRAARVELKAQPDRQKAPAGKADPYEPETEAQQAICFAGGWKMAPLYQGPELLPGARIAGPALIVGPSTTVVVEPDWVAELTAAEHLVLTRRAKVSAKQPGTTAVDPVRLALFNNQFTGIAEQMGATLQRTSLSVNVKERLDFSCAIFARDGGLIVNAPHIPVHLGSMGDSVRAVVQEAGASLAPGDVYVTNDPYRGGSHLPDVTVITPVFAANGKELLFFTGNRAHHAEIGGITPGSMPPLSRTLAEEGVLIRCQKLVSGQKSGEAQLEALLKNAPFPSRAVADNLADVRAQIAANEVGRQRLLELMAEQGQDVVLAYMGHMRDAAARQMQRALRGVAAGSYRFEDAMDDGTKIVVTASVTHEGAAARARLDFTGSGPVARGNLNANRAIVKAAALYALRCLINAEIPLNEGVLAGIDFVVPEPSILAPGGGDRAPGELPAVTSGNVETSQRLVDVLLGALGLAAASQGTMNNLLFGRAATKERPGFGYYETVCGGAGAGPGFAGASAVHTHMTNTRITDPEVLEERFPVRLWRFQIRRGSGGGGQYPGGDGVVRELEFLEALDLSLITSRRVTDPYGLAGGEPGQRGLNTLVHGTGEVEALSPMAQVPVKAGDRLILETPGGGGYGRKK